MTSRRDPPVDSLWTFKTQMGELWLKFLVAPLRLLPTVKLLLQIAPSGSDGTSRPFKVALLRRFRGQMGFWRGTATKSTTVAGLAKSAESRFHVLSERGRGIGFLSPLPVEQDRATFRSRCSAQAKLVRMTHRPCGEQIACMNTSGVECRSANSRCDSTVPFRLPCEGCPPKPQSLASCPRRRLAVTPQSVGLVL